MASVVDVEVEEVTTAPASDAELMPTTEDKGSQDGEDDNNNDRSLECGFLVDRITTVPYQKATERGEVPFCAFAPISTQELYLLRIQECPADKTRHMLMPASKDDVFSTPGALKTMDEDQEPGNEESMNYRVAIVAIARQIFNEVEKQLVVSVDPLLKKDKKRIQVVKFLEHDKFAEFAFLGFDGNVGEFVNSNANNNETSNKQSQATTNQQNRNSSQQQPPAEDKNVMSTPAVTINVKSPPKAPARRGRGGRRRMSRKSPIITSPKTNFHSVQQFQPPPSQYFPAGYQQLSGVTLSHDLPNDFTQALIKLEQNERETQQFISQQGYQMPLSQVPDSSLYAQQDSFIGASDVPLLQVPTPVSEVTISTTEPGADAGAQETNHDLITIAFDQLVGMSSEVSSSDAHAHVSEKSSRGGRRAGPGRKPGRKPLKDRHPNQIDVVDDNAMFGHLTSDEPPVVPKRRGRPPKNRAPMHILGLENENSNQSSGLGIDNEVKADFENHEKRIKMQMMD